MARTGGKALREPLGDHGPKHLYRNIADSQGGRFRDLFTPEARRVERLQVFDGDFRLANCRLLIPSPSPPWCGLANGHLKGSRVEVTIIGPWRRASAGLLLLRVDGAEVVYHGDLDPSCL
jgi:hypothetical protein